MKVEIIVAGCGKIGKSVLSALVSEGHNVVVIDENPKIIDDVTNMYDAMGVCGDAADYETLKEAGVEKAELFVSTVSSDETNMLACLIARRMGAKHTIARVRNMKYNGSGLNFLRQQTELSLALNPEYLAATEAFNILKFPSAVKIETFQRRNFELVQIKLKEDSALDNMKLSDLRKKFDAKFLVCAVQRNNEVIIPSGDFVLKGGDRVGLSGSLNEIQKLFKELGILKKSARNIVILGGSRTAYYLSKMLISAGHTVKVVDTDRAKCHEFSDMIKGITVINGDGATQEVLLEEGLRSADAFVSLTGIDEENILMSFFAQSKGVGKVISKVNREELGSIAEKMGLDCIVYPKKIIADIMVRYARAISDSMGSNVESLYTLMDDKVEALEFAVKDGFKYSGIPFSELSIKENVLIGGIIRGRKPIIPSGSDMIMPDDRVVVIAAGERIERLEDIIK